MPSVGPWPLGREVLTMENELDLFTDAPRDAPAGVVSPTQQLRRAVCKRLRVGIIVFIAAAPLFLLAVVILVKPLYLAKASVQVNMARPRILYDTEENEPSHSYETFFETQMALITNKAVLERCLQAPGVSEAPLLAGVADKVRKLQKSLSVELIEHTQLFSVSLQHPCGRGLADVVNAVLDAYVGFLDENEATTQNRKIVLLESERRRLLHQTQQLREKLAQLREELASDPNAPPGAYVYDPVSVAQEAIVQARAEQYSLQARVASLKASLEQDDVSVAEQAIEEALSLDPEVERLTSVSMGIRESLIAAQIEATKPASVIAQQRMESDPEVIALREEIAEHELEVARLSKTLKEMHPMLQSARDALNGCYARLAAMRESFSSESGQEEARRNAKERVQDLQSQLDLVQEQIERRRARMRPVIVKRLKEQERAEIRRQIQELTWQAEAAGIRVQVLADNLKRQLQQRTRYERRSARFVSLQESLRRSNESLSAVEQRLHELEVESAAPGYVSIAMRASQPAAPEPHLGRRLRYGFMAVVAAAGLSVLVMVVIERRDDSIWSEEDIDGCLGAPLLGSVPAAGPRFEQDDRAALACFYDSETVLAEEIRNVAAGLLHPADRRPLRTILVTSAGPAEGKTTLSVNLATCVSNAGKRALLIDANFRKPDIAAIFGLGNMPGLGDVLTGDEVVMLPEDSALSVLPAGTPPQHADLLASPAMEDLLRRMKADHDCVIIDAPPLTLAETRLLAPMADGVVLTAKAFASRRSAVVSSVEILNRLGARPVGLVLLGARKERAAAGTAQTLQAYSKWPRLTRMKQFVPIEEEVVASARAGDGHPPADP